MAPIIDFSNLSDQELSQMLKDYGVLVGPINLATRKTYERKLLKLKTGQESPPSQRYTPVDDDEDEDDEVQIRQPVRYSPVKADYSQARQRKEIQEQREAPETYSSSPRIESRPSLSTSKKTTTSYVPAADDRLPHYQEKRRKNTTSGTGIPLWVKIVFIAVILVLGFLLYTNMESAAKSEIPSIANTVEV